MICARQIIHYLNLGVLKPIPYLIATIIMIISPSVIFVLNRRYEVLIGNCVTILIGKINVFLILILVVMSVNKDILRVKTII